MSWESNPYYKPESLGLEIICTVDRSAPDYSFDFAVVWKHSDGSFYAGIDMGCSCPSPFEDVSSLSDLEGPMTAHQAVEWLKESGTDYAAGAIVDAIPKILEA